MYCTSTSAGAWGTRLRVARLVIAALAPLRYENLCIKRARITSMIPLRDDNPTTIVPVMTVGLIVLNILVFLYQI